MKRCHVKNRRVTQHAEDTKAVGKWSQEQESWMEMGFSRSMRKQLGEVTNLSVFSARKAEEETALRSLNGAGWDHNYWLEDWCNDCRSVYGITFPCYIQNQFQKHHVLSNSLSSYDSYTGRGWAPFKICSTGSVLHCVSTKFSLGHPDLNPFNYSKSKSISDT